MKNSTCNTHTHRIVFALLFLILITRLHAVGHTDDFDPDIDQSLWSNFEGTVEANQHGQQAGPGSTGKSLWFGGTGTRAATTVPIDTRGGGTIAFDIALGSGNGLPWEDVNLVPSQYEAIILEYSTNGAGYIQIGNDFQNKTWQSFTFPIPAGAMGSATKFRFRQISHSGSNYDHWAIDNLNIIVVTTGEIEVSKGATQLVSGGAGLTFGAAVVGTTGSSQSLVVKNSGDLVLGNVSAIISGVHATDFSLDTSGLGSSITPGTQDTLSIVFTPKGLGTRTAKLQITSDDSDENPFEINLTATGQAPEIEISNGSGGLDNGMSTVEFGKSLVRASGGAEVFTISNTGTSPLTELQVQLIGSIAQDFTLNTNALATTVQPGATTNFSVTFSPATLGVRTGILRIRSSDLDEGQFDIQITGTGVQPDIAIFHKTQELTTPAQGVDLGSETMGLEAAEEIFMISNTGGYPLSGISMTMAGANPGDFRISGAGVPDVIEPGQTATFGVIFAPSGIGTRTAILTVASDDPDETSFEIHLQGAGLIPPADIAITNGSQVLVDAASGIDFGNLDSDVPRGAKQILITNTGGEDLTGISFSIDGSDAALFSVDTAGTASSLAPGESTSFIIAFAANNFDAYSATLHVTSSDPDESPFDIALTAALVERPSDYTSDGIFTVDTGTSSFNPQNLTSFGNGALFTTSNGYKLWYTDLVSPGGTIQLSRAAGVSGLSGVIKGAADGSTPTFLISGDKAYFVGFNDSNGRELWVTDGTTEGTKMVIDLNPGTGSGVIVPGYLMAAVQGGILFTGQNADSGLELFFSDGTPEGTVLIKDIEAGSGNSYPGPGAKVAGGHVFAATRSDIGRELWFTDGTPEGTTLVADIRVGTSSGVDPYFVSLGDNALFQANDGTSGTELWITDGTSEGTLQLKDIRVGSPSSFTSERRMVVAGGKVYFRAYSADSGSELWMSDGTQSGTVQVAEINPNGSSSPADLVAYGNKLLFTATDGSHGKELWITDGTAAGTHMVTDFTSGSGGTDILSMVAGTSFVFFWADDGIHGEELYRTDGLSVELVKDINQGIGSSTPDTLPLVLGDYLYAPAFDGGASGRELWGSDGSESGTELLFDLGTSLGSVHSSISFNGQLFFNGDGPEGRELWKSDGTLTGTTLVKDITPGTVGIGPTGFFVANGILYFTADDEIHGRELWKTDGTEAGTEMVMDLKVGPSGAFDYSELVAVELSGKVILLPHKLYSLYALNPATDDLVELTPDLKHNIFTENVASFVFNGFVYFGAEDSASNHSVWQTDGTLAGTSLVKTTGTGNVNESDIDVEAGNFEASAGVLYFRAGSTGFGTELWKSDGTSAGTSMVSDIRQDTPHYGSYPKGLTAHDGKVFFKARDGAAIENLWVSDGTNSGTIKLGVFANIWEPRFASFAGKFYFEADDGTGIAMWTSDGTVENTKKVPGLYGFIPGPVIGGWMYFVSEDEESGRELRATDGDSIILVEELGPSFLSGVATGGAMTAVGDNLFYSGWNGQPGVLAKSGLRVIGPTTGNLNAPDITVEHPVGQYLANNSSSLDFGEIRLGTIEEREITIYNTGASVLTGISVSISGPDSSEYALATSPASSLNPAESTTFRVRFTPTTEGVKRASLRIASNDPVKNPFDIGVIGVGSLFMTPPTSIELDSASVFENLTAWTHVGNLSATDEDPDETISFSLVTGTGDADNTSFRIVGSELLTNVVFDQETQATRYIRIRATDQFALTLEKEFVITIQDDRTEDADNDGLTEAEEEDLYGTLDTETDSDGDTYSDLDEINAGSDPTNIYSLPPSGPPVADYLINFGKLRSNGNWAHVPAEALNTGNPMELIDRNRNPSQIFIRGFGQLDHELLAHNASDLGVANGAYWNDGNYQGVPGQAHWNSGNPKDWVDPESVADYILGDMGASYVFAISGLDPSRRYKIELLSATSPSTAQVAYRIYRTLDGVDSLVKLPDGNRNGTEDGNGQLLGTHQGAEWNTREEGWAEKNWVIWSGERPGIDPSAGTGSIYGVDENDLVIGVSGATYSSWAVNAMRITILPEPEIEVENAGQILISGGPALDYGASAIGSPLELTVSVKNTGQDTLSNLSLTLNGADSSDFLIQSGLPDYILPGASASFTVIFTPSTEGSRNTILGIISNDFDENPFLISLAGTGMTANDLFNETLATENPALQGNDALPDSIPFDDGVPNLLKYAFNMNLAGSDTHALEAGGSSGLPGGKLVETNGETVLRVEYVRRKGSGLIYTPQKSGTLAPGSFEPLSGTETVSDIVGAPEWERVTVDEPCDPATSARCFSRVKVALP
ncbi:MAG: choice-of-anchor D domain-containing protein [Akkermansiaceae bacterium]|nr:choice-of-anchor D domain-containing protein [Akkermansiaceae bacterium]